MRPLLVLALLIPVASGPVAAAWPPFPTSPEQVVRDATAAARAGRVSEARRLYLEAAGGLPEIGDWLLRRAALLLPDSAGRADLYARITLPVVLARLPETEALARERTGDLAGAALRYDSLDRVVDASRVRLRMAATADERHAVRGRLVEFIGQRAGTPEGLAAIDFLSASRLELAPSEVLIVAQAALRARQAARAVGLFRRGISAGLATPDDRLAYGIALAQLGRHREAMAVFARIASGTPAAREATYQRAFSLSRLGMKDSALTLLTGLAAADDSEMVVAPKALFLAAEIRWRAGDAVGAREQWLEVARRYPLHEVAGRAGFLAALVPWESGRTTEAAEEWERLYQLNSGPDGLAAGYWAGRAYNQLGDTSRAVQLWRSVIARDSLSYYAVASARRLGVEPWSPAAAPDQFEPFPDLDSTATRMAQLRGLEMSEELGWERDRLQTDPTSSPERLLACAHLLREYGQPAAALTVGRRALQLGAHPDARTYRLLFPLLHADELRQRAAALGLDPVVVAALIRQESNWEPTARSRAGALGLMQVMPATGRRIAKTLGLARWDSALLFDPVTNIRLGTHYLADALRHSKGDLAQALAAYNAGPGRVSVWAAGAAGADPELFVERITIKETRDYVRIVQRNLSLYRALYGF